MSQNIFLIGFMGAGKSTVARELRDHYGMRLIEMDEQIEAEEGRPISQIFAESGEAYFRTLETQLLLSLEHESNTVVSCGGGVPLREENVAAMRLSGTIVYLCAAPETIYERVKDFHTRPLLEGNMNVEYIKNLMAQRIPKYQSAADITVTADGSDVRAVCEEILRNVLHTHSRID
ncbi:MAG: shikimate kinase [Lachnospiraceae bacterium]|nr:shikimate kinase [Lachnospiraceae bacterium]